MAHSFQLSLAYAILLLTGMSGVLLLVGFYQEGPRNRVARRARRFAASWEFTVSSLGGFTWFRLAVASLLSLFLEMLLIRWIAAEVSAFAYFKNVVLIGCFLGFGLGCYLSRIPINLLAFLFPIGLLVSVIKLPWPALREVIREIPYLIAPSSQITLLGTPDIPVNFAGTLSAILIIVLLFGLVAFVFVPLGQIVGWCLESSKNGIVAYTVNVLASLAGIVLYAVLCFSYQPPAVWFAFSGVAASILLWKIPRLRWTSLVVFAFCVGFVSLGPGKPRRELWSPYQKITLTPMPSAEQPIAYELRTNDTWYQKIINLSPEFTAAHPDLFLTVPVQWNAYNVPYHFFPQPPSVLVLGAGTGNDVAAAVRNGAGRIVAVEIDPLILQMGRDLHFEKPYQSNRVKTVVDDARSYIQNSEERFDLIVFSLLDSHTTSSSYSNIRIDNYVYTLEALKVARRLLKPDGIFIVKFWVTTPWIAGRLYSLMKTVFQQPPLDLNAVASEYTTPGRFFISGSQERIQQALADPSLHSYLSRNPILERSSTVITTDDWPYFYQRERGIPLSFALLSLVLALFCWQVLQRTGAAVGSFHWHFFFLGAGFMLLETQTVSKMALLFGTTWLVNSVVVGGLLLLIVAANIVVQRFPAFPYLASYAGIYVSIAIAYFVPLGRFFFSSPWLKAFSATAVLCLPVFFAGMIFIRSFAQIDFNSEALGSNLFGALVGGLLEAVSYWTGIKSLLLLAVILYSASWICLRTGKRTRAEATKSVIPAVPERASA
jgi:SAM-dependent methyltransferase